MAARCVAGDADGAAARAIASFWLVRKRLSVFGVSEISIRAGTIYNQGEKIRVCHANQHASACSYVVHSWGDCGYLTDNLWSRREWARTH